MNAPKPGETVVDLAGLTRSSAAVAGAVAAASLARSAGQGWLFAMGALLLGGGLGLLAGAAAARAFYRAEPGRTIVVRAGPSALPVTLLAGLAGGVAASVAVAVPALLLPAGGPAVVPIVAGVAVGLVWGALAALL